jgi:hypothetical protein
MAALLMIKEKIKLIYANYSRVIVPIIKAIVAFLMLTAINDKIGYMSRLDNLLVVVAISALCAITPKSMTVIVAAVVALLHLTALSIEVALIAAAVFLVMVLLYVRFCSKDILLLILVPMSFYFGVPYVTPLVTGVLCGPAAALTLGCGVIIHYFIDYVSVNAVTIQGLPGAVEKIRICLDGIIQNDAMIMAVLSFVAATAVVYILRRQAIDNAWTIAIFCGAMTNVILNFMGILILDDGPGVIGLLLGTIIAVPLAMLVAFLFMGLDYKRTERVQFEDEDYYYYVKAVPKMKIQAPSKTVKKINTQKYRTHHK